MEPNRLVLNIQPDEGVSVSFVRQAARHGNGIGNVNMNFRYREGFGDEARSAYSTLLSDCVRGDATLFDRGDNVEAAWALVDPILDVWSAAKTAERAAVRLGQLGAAGIESWNAVRWNVEDPQCNQMRSRQDAPVCSARD